MPHLTIPMDIKELTKAELEEWCVAHGHKPYRARQVLKWVYHRRAHTFDEMSDVSLGLRATLTTAFSIDPLACVQCTPAADGTQKYLFALADQRCIESVCIPADDRTTLCVSSQVGCAMGCQFCATAQIRPVRNLTAGEIVSQIWHVQGLLPEERPLTNVVFMGMGEPLANYDHVVKAIGIITAEWGLNFSPRRVTVSSVGLVPYLRRLLEDTQVNLTVSLTATTDAVRNTLMPINTRYPLEQLLEACRSLPTHPRNRLTFAYTLLSEVNDSLADARRLTKLLHGIRAKVNLIPFNAFPGSAFTPSPRLRIQQFRQILLDKGVHATIRESRGQDVQAACGQLATAAANQAA